MLQWSCPGYQNIFNPYEVKQSIRKKVTVDHEEWLIDGWHDTFREDYQELIERTLSHVDAYALAYSVTSWTSFSCLPSWHSKVENFLREKSRPWKQRYMATSSKSGSRKPPLVGLIATRCDTVYEPYVTRYVSRAEGEELASRLGCQYIKTSLRPRTNVDETFLALAKAYKAIRLRERLPEQKQQEASMTEKAEPKQRTWKRLDVLRKKRV